MILRLLRQSTHDHPWKKAPSFSVTDEESQRRLRRNRVVL
jgi:hypothetical protein